MSLNIAAAIQSQMLQTLLQALQSTDKPLTAGETVEATFVSWSTTPAGDSSHKGKPPLAEALIQLGGKPTTLLIDATPERRAALQAGMVLRLKVDTAPSDGAPSRMRLVDILPAPTAAGSSADHARIDLAHEASAAPAPPAAAKDAARAAAGPLLGVALGRQTGLAPLYADIDALIRAPVSLPRTVLDTAAKVAALRMDAGALATAPDALKTAVASSGLLHEAMLAKGEHAAADDLKGALIVLKQALASALDRVLPGDGQPTAAAEPRDRPTPTASTRLQAPTRDGFPTPQGASLPSIDIAADSAVSMMAKALDRTEGAIDRISLNQFASLPTASDASQGIPGTRLFVELPLALEGRTTVLPLEIEDEHGSGGSTDPSAKLWRVRFALDVEPMGPLHAMVTMQGRAIGVTVWAERDKTSQVIRDHAPDLRAALLDNDFDNPQIEVLSGQPTKRPAHAGHYLDRRS